MDTEKEHYRKRAQEIRALAELADPNVRPDLLNAAQYLEAAAAEAPEWLRVISTRLH